MTTYPKDRKSKAAQYVKPLETAFWEKVIPEPNSGCWLWTGACNGKGRAQIGVKANGQKFKIKNASHISLQLHGRSVPKGMCVLHSCDNTFCVNPDHLFVGTQDDNIQDMIAKGRYRPPARKEFCIRGHPLWLDGRPGCRECHRLWQAKYKAEIRNGTRHPVTSAG
jgi:hypothetical protein